MEKLGAEICRCTRQGLKVMPWRKPLIKVSLTSLIGVRQYELWGKWRTILYEWVKLICSKWTLSLCSNFVFEFADKASECNESDNCVGWLKNSVLPKIVKWASEVGDDGMKPEQGSLALVNIQEYNELYQKLKVKYGQPLVEVRLPIIITSYLQLFIINFIIPCTIFH